MTYALTFCLDNSKLKQLYPNPPRWKDAYQDIAQVLSEFGFISYQSAFYISLPDVDALQCILATQKLAQTYDWFLPVLTDIRMLEIHKMTDLALAVASLSPQYQINPQEKIL